MLSQVITKQVGQHRTSRQEVVDTSSVREFLRTNPPSFTRSNPIEDPKNFMEEVNKAFCGNVYGGC